MSCVFYHLLSARGIVWKGPEDVWLTHLMHGTSVLERTCGISKILVSVHVGCLVSRLWPLTRVWIYKCQQYRSVQELILQSAMLPACLQIVPCHFGFRFCISFMLTETCMKPFWTTSIASSAGELGALTTCKPKPCNVSRRNHCTECQQAAHTWRPAVCAKLMLAFS